MDSEIAHSGQWYAVLGWLEKNRNQIIGIAAVALVAGGVWWYVKCAREEKELKAGEALSAVLLSSTQGQASADALLKHAGDNAGTEAGGRALLAAAGQQFADGKYDDSLASFRRFLSEYEGSVLTPQAKLGVASCLQAQGKTPEATTAYKEVVDRFASANTVTPAKFALARIYDSEGKLEQARDLYLELARDPQSTIGSEAGSRLSELIQAHPNLRPGATATNATSVLPVK